MELTAQISGAVDPNLAIARLRDRLVAISNVAKDPGSGRHHPEFNPFGPVLGDAVFPGPMYPLAVHEPKARTQSAA